ncbi:MAG: hypothetical protein AAFY98_09585 [Verrucomicrobiota bacterium]
MKWLVLFLFFSLSVGQGKAIEIQIDYTYDTNNFFDTDEKKAVMEAVADFFGDMIDDQLLSIDASQFFRASWTASFIDPSTGGSVNLSNLVVPEDVIIIYVGSRNLPGNTVGVAGPGGFGASGASSWIDRIVSRGQTGVSDSPVTDVSLWGGSIAFDTTNLDDSTRVWNFSLNSNDGSEGGTEFMTVALHEMCHVLGIGIEFDPGTSIWEEIVSNGIFTGGAAARSNGNISPSVSGDGHFIQSLTSQYFGSFGATHGHSAPVLMVPSSTDSGTNFDVITDLDLASLQDLGWEIKPKTGFSATALSPAAVSLQWNSVSFKDYAVDRSTALPGGFSTVRASANGNAQIQSWTDPSPPAGQAFYQLIDTDIVTASSASELQSGSKEPESTFSTIYRAPVVVNCNRH